MTTTTTQAGQRDRMWRAAWRQHRTFVVISVSLVAALGVLLFLVGRGLPECTPDPSGQDVNGCYDLIWNEVRWVMPIMPLYLGAPPVLGLLAGVVAFGPDAERRTQIFALTQGVGRLRWWSVKLLVVGMPLLLAFVGLGLVGHWFVSAHAEILAIVVGQVRMDVPLFELVGPIPVAMFVLSLAVGATVTLQARSTILGLVIGGMVIVALMVGGIVARPFLVPQDRVVASVDGPPDAAWAQLESNVSGPWRPWQQDFGYLDAKGDKVDWNGCPQLDLLWEEAEKAAVLDAEGNLVGPPEAEWNRVFRECYAQAGIRSTFIGYVDDSRYGRLVLTVAMIQLGLAAVILTAGGNGLRRRDL